MNLFLPPPALEETKKECVYLVEFQLQIEESLLFTLPGNYRFID